MNWILQQPGTLVLDGTIMSIVYKPGNFDDFHIFQGDRKIQSVRDLDYAKFRVEQLLDQLKEIGLAE